MGLFSKMRSGKAGGAAEQVGAQVHGLHDIARGLVTMPVLMAGADGKIEQAETNEIISLCMQNSIFLQLGGEATGALIGSVARDINTRGRAAVFEDAVRALPMKLRETAACFAIRVAISDGSIDPNEMEMLKQMGAGLEIPVERFIQIFDVLMMLHRSEAA